jgi:hypothetical protein
MKLSNWQASGKPQAKSTKTPRARQQKAKALKAMAQRLK